MKYKNEFQTLKDLSQIFCTRCHRGTAIPATGTDGKATQAVGMSVNNCHSATACLDSLTTEFSRVATRNIE